MHTPGDSEMKEATVDYRTGLQFPALHDPRYPIHHVVERIEPYLRRIVEQLHPERIILFGSYAYGQPTLHSDFDLLIVRRGISSSKESNLEIRRAIRGIDAPSAPFTFLSQTPEDLDEKLKTGSFVYREIVNKGLELYAA